MDQVVGMICFERPVMNASVGMKRIAKTSQWSMHHIPMKEPFQNGRIEDACEEQ